MKIITFSFFIILLYSCGNKKQIIPYQAYYQSENSLNYKDSITFKTQGSVSFPIDSVTPQSFECIQNFSLDGVDYLSFLNSFNGKIYIYNDSTKELVKTVNLPKKSQNGSLFNFEKMGYSIITLDSIILNDHWDSSIMLIDGKGGLRSLIVLPVPSSKTYSVGTTSTTDQPLIVIGSKVYVLGYLLSYTIKDQTALRNAYSVDINSRQIKQLIPRPELYNRGTWASEQFGLYAAFNSKTKRIIYSFAAEPYIYAYNPESDKYVKHYVGSKYFKAVLPFSSDKDLYNNENADLRLLNQHNYLTPQYYKVMYDSYRKLYYRFTHLPITNKQFDSPNRDKLRTETIIILNESFKKVGEVKLPNQLYSQNMAYISKVGLNIAKLPKYQENENVLTFTTLKIIKK